MSEEKKIKMSVMEITAPADQAVTAVMNMRMYRTVAEAHAPASVLPAPHMALVEFEIKRGVEEPAISAERQDMCRRWMAKHGLEEGSKHLMIVKRDGQPWWVDQTAGPIPLTIPRVSDGPIGTVAPGIIMRPQEWANNKDRAVKEFFTRAAIAGANPIGEHSKNLLASTVEADPMFGRLHTFVAGLNALRQSPIWSIDMPFADLSALFEGANSALKSGVDYLPANGRTAALAVGLDRVARTMATSAALQGEAPPKAEDFSTLHAIGQHLKGALGYMGDLVSVPKMLEDVDKVVGEADLLRFGQQLHERLGDAEKGVMSLVKATGLLESLSAGNVKVERVRD